ncbi:MAG: DUF1800 family protein [Opitutales bacterium]
MTTSVQALQCTPDTAWLPLPDRQWNPDKAAHLLRRMGYSATPAAVREAMANGLRRTVDRALDAAEPLEEPEAMRMVRKEYSDIIAKVRAAGSPEARREILRTYREKQRGLFEDYVVAWTHHAAQPANAAREKWTAFLQDVLVVSRDSVRNAIWHFDYHALLREKGFGPYPDLVKAVSRHPVMIRYLDLYRSSAAAPNENFARELFELFTLGEGNYTEADIKEAARAFTGYHHRLNGEFNFLPGRHDHDEKTIFERTREFDGDDVIDLVFNQPAAATFLPNEALRYYLSHEPMPEGYVERLGELWREEAFDLRRLAALIFNARVFFEPAFMGNRYKSPHEFYLGLCQDLGIGTLPFAGPLLRAYQTMGQSFLAPPNVRGWVGGRHWFNSTSLAARWRLVESLLEKPNEARLDADERARLVAARDAGWADHYIDPRRVAVFAGNDPTIITARLMAHFFTGRNLPDYKQQLLNFLRSNRFGTEAERTEAVALALLKSPAYQRC